MRMGSERCPTSARRRASAYQSVLDSATTIGPPGRRRARARVHGHLQAPSPAALPLLPLPPSQRQRRAGRAASRPSPRRWLHFAKANARHRCGPGCSNRPQRGDFAPATCALRTGAVGGRPVSSDRLGGGAGRPKRPSGGARGGSASAARAAAKRPGDARAKRFVARGNRAGPRNLPRRRQAGDLRSTRGAGRTQGGACDAV